MSTKVIDGRCYARMLLGGAAVLAAHTEELNALNVFPVCDGDTGTNMLKTIEGGLCHLKENATQSIATLSDSFAKGILLSARGNSGVILSQIFAGINEGLEGHTDVTAYVLAQAYRKGIEKSYAAVQNPTEGTILTVFRESTEYATANITKDSSVEDFFRLHLDEAKRSLAATKELLPVLAQADVVDSGAAGYLYVAQGMYNALSGEITSYSFTQTREETTVDIDLFTRDSVLEFGYCTEFLLRLTTAKVDPDAFEIEPLIAKLEELGGESIVAYKQGDIVKVHVHTFDVAKVFACAQKYGEFLTVKVENMSLGHSQITKEKPKSDKAFSLVAVASGDGIAALFTQMGVDHIISGGQTSNPSIEEFIEAFKKCDTEHIIVFPNNKNILLAAKQAAQLYTDANIHIVESKNLMQGFGALSIITPGITDIDALVSSAQNAAESVIDGEVTKAVRDAEIDGFSVKCGDYVSISSGRIVAVEQTAELAVIRMLENSDTDLCEIITMFVGKDVSNERRTQLTQELTQIYEDCEIVVYEGGQDIYDYYLAIE